MYTYDAARRVSSIEHKHLGGRILKLEYEYLDNDLVFKITERDTQANPAATTTFTYDTRGRLTGEVRADIRSPSQSYDLAYAYDQGGNRSKKTKTLDSTHWFEDRYFYDIAAPLTYASNNNRLEKVETWEYSPSILFAGEDPEGALAMGGPTGTLRSTTWYYYTGEGNVERVLSNQAGSNVYNATRLHYGKNGRTVTYVIGESWNWNGNPTSNPTSYGVSFAREFRYDQARGRYLDRKLDPAALMGGNYQSLSETWSDYDGDQIYGDFEVTQPPGNPLPTPYATDRRSFEPSLGRVDPWTADTAANSAYFHSDLIGTTRFMTPASGNSIDPSVFTAFGERIAGTVGGPDDRYGYAGTWGYQTHQEFAYLHLGHRYYDPSTGRFIQRDSIGIAGGINAYLYVDGNPVIFVDPLGQTSWTGWPNKGRIRYGPSRPIGGGGRRLAFRIGSKGLHLFGTAGAGAFAGSCVVAAGVGAGVGYGINKGTEAATGQSLSDWIGGGLFKLCPSCWY